MNFQLFYTTSGQVGRKTWWLTQFITGMLFVIFFALLIAVAQHASGISGPHTVLGYLRSFSHLADTTYEMSDLSSRDTALFCTLAAAVLLTFWVHFVIEVKRWHDLGQSGYWVLLRLAPGLSRHFLPALGAAVVSVLLFSVVGYLLGFRPGISSNGTGSKNRS